MRTSARNQWSGKVTEIDHGAVNDEVEIELSGGDRVVSTITRESVGNLGLDVGQDVVALVKASSVMVGVDGGDRLRLSARNQLAGTVMGITPGAVNSEIIIALRGGSTVTAIITNAAAKELQLSVGEKVFAIFKASSVLLGVV